MGKLHELTTITQKAKDKNAPNADSLIIPSDPPQTSRPHASVPAINDCHRGVYYEPRMSTSEAGDNVRQIANATSTQSLRPLAVQDASSLLHQIATSSTLHASGVTSSPSSPQISSIPPQNNSPKPKVADATTPQHNCSGSRKVVQSVSKQSLNKPGYVASPGVGVHSLPSVQEISTSAHRQMSSPSLERVPLPQAQPVSLPKSIQVSVSPSVRSSVTDTSQGTKSSVRSSVIDTPQGTKSSVRSSVIDVPQGTKSSVRSSFIDTSQGTKSSVRSSVIDTPQGTKSSVRSSVTDTPQGTKSSVRSSVTDTSQGTKSSVRSSVTDTPQGNKSSVRSSVTDTSQGTKSSVRSSVIDTSQGTKSSVRSSVTDTSQGNKSSVRSLVTDTSQGTKSSVRSSVTDTSQGTKSSVTDTSQGTKSSVRSSVTDTSQGTKSSVRSLVTDTSQGNKSSVRSSVIDTSQGNKSSVRSSVTDMSQGNKSSVRSSVIDTLQGNKSSVRSSVTDTSQGNKSSVRSSVIDTPQGTKSSVRSSVIDTPQGTKSSVRSSVIDTPQGTKSSVTDTSQGTKSSVRSSVTDTPQDTKSCQERSSCSVESAQTLSRPAEKSLERVQNMKRSMTKQLETEVPQQLFCSDVETPSLNRVHNAKSVLPRKSSEKATLDSLPRTGGDDEHLEHLNSSALLDTSKIKLVSDEECLGRPQMSISNDGENRQKKKYNGKRIFQGDSITQRRSGMKGGCDIYGNETVLPEDEERRRRRSLPTLSVCLKRLDPTKLNLESPVVEKRKVGRPLGSTKKKASSGMSPFSSLKDTSQVFLAKRALYEYLVKRGLVESSGSRTAEKSSLLRDNSVKSSKGVDTVNGKMSRLSGGAEYSPLLQDSGFRDSNMKTKVKDISQEDSGGKVMADMPKDSGSIRMQEAVSTKSLLDNVAKGQQDGQQNSQGAIRFLPKPVENQVYGHLPKSTIASSENNVAVKVNHFQKNSHGSKEFVMASSSTEDSEKVCNCHKKKVIAVEDRKKAKLLMSKTQSSVLNANSGPGRKKRCCCDLFKTCRQNRSLDTESHGKKEQTVGIEIGNEEKHTLEFRGAENTLKKKGRPHSMRTSDIGLEGETSGGVSCKDIPQLETRSGLSQSSDDKEMVKELNETGSEYHVGLGQRKADDRRKGSKRLRDDVEQLLQEDKDALLQTGPSWARFQVEDGVVGRKLICRSSDTLAEEFRMDQSKKSYSETDVMSVDQTKRPYKKPRTDAVNPKLSSDAASRKKRPYKKRSTEVMNLQLSEDAERSLNRKPPIMKMTVLPKREIVEGDVSRGEQPVAKKSKDEDSDSFTAEGGKSIKGVLHSNQVKESSFRTHEKGRFFIVEENVERRKRGRPRKDVTKRRRGRPPKPKPQEEEELIVETRKGNSDGQCSDDFLSGPGEAEVSVSSRTGASINEGSGKLKEDLEDSDATEVKKRGPYEKKKEIDQTWSPRKDRQRGRKVQLCKKNMENLPSTTSGRFDNTKQSASSKQQAKDKKLLRGYLSQAAVKRYSSKQNKMSSRCYQGARLRKTRAETESQKENEGKKKTSATFLSAKKMVKQSENSESIALRLLNHRRSVMNQTMAKPKQQKTMTAKWKCYLDRVKRASALRRSAIASAAATEKRKRGRPLKKRGQEDTVGSDVKTEGSDVNRKSVKVEASSVKQLYKPPAANKATKLSSVKSMNGNGNKKAKTQKELIENRGKPKEGKQLIENRLRSMRVGREREMATREKKRRQVLRLLRQRGGTGTSDRKKMPRSSIKSKSVRKDEFTVIGREEPRSKKPEEKAKRLRSEKSSTHLKTRKRKAPSTSPVIEIERDPAFDDGEFTYPGSPGRAVRKPRLLPVSNPVPGSPVFYQLRNGCPCDLSHSCCQKSKATKVDVSTQWEDPLPLYSALMYRDMFSLARRDSGLKLEPGDWTLDQESLLGSLMNLARQENSYLTLGKSTSGADQHSPNVPPSFSNESWENSPSILPQTSSVPVSGSSIVQTPVGQKTDSLMNMGTPHSVHVQINDSCSSFTVVKTEPHRQKCNEMSPNNAPWNQEWDCAPETNAVDNQMVEVNAEEKLQEGSSQDLSCPVIFAVGSVSEEDFSKASLTDADSVCGGESRNLAGISPCIDLTQPCSSSNGDNCGDGDNSENYFRKGHAPKFRSIDSQEKPELQGQDFSPNRSERGVNPQNVKKRVEENENGIHFTACNGGSMNRKPDQNSLDTAAILNNSVIDLVSDDSDDDHETYHANTCAPSQYVENASVIERLKNSTCDKPLLNCSEKRVSGSGLDRSRQDEDPKTSASLPSCDPPSNENQLLQEFPSDDFSEHCNDPFKNVIIFVHDNGQISDYPNEDVS